MGIRVHPTLCEHCICTPEKHSVIRMLVNRFVNLFNVTFWGYVTERIFLGHKLGIIVKLIYLLIKSEMIW